MHQETTAVRTWTPLGLVALSSYWFATSFKWFLLLIFLLPGHVARIVPGGEKSAYWGAVFGVGAIWAVIGPALFGSISDKVGDRRPFLVLGSLLTCLSLLALHSATGIVFLAAAYLLLQISDDLSTGPYSATLPEQVSTEQRGLAGGIMSGASSLAQVAAVVVMLALPLTTVGQYVLIAALNLSTAVLAVQMMGRVRSRPTESKRGLSAWLSAFRNGDFRSVWAVRFLVTLGFYLVIPYANFYIRDMVPDLTLFGITLPSPDRATAVLALAIAIFGAAGSLLAGPVCDRAGRKPVSVVSALIMAAGLVIAFVFLPGMNLMAGVAVLFGFGYGAFQAANWALISDVLPDPEGLGRDMGLWQMSISSVQLFAGAAGLIVTFGNRWSHGAGYRMLFLLATISVLGSAFVIRSVRGAR